MTNIGLNNNLKINIMKKEKITRATLDELEKTMPVLSEIEQYSIVGGGDGSAGNPYTVMEFEGMCESGSWRGGYVEGWGYIFQDVVVDSTNNDDNKLNNNIINFCGFILSM
ncbi:MAG: hypothetical protein Q4F97_12525 [Bacteroidales bacterium]|nr:hypothetical protein [Bacteroidales bacterium]